MVRHLVAIGVLSAIAAGAYGLSERDRAQSRNDLPAEETSYAALAKDPSSRPAVMPTTREFVQQTFGTLCETPQGVCTVSPQPINSPCQCGTSYGRIVR